MLIEKYLDIEGELEFDIKEDERYFDWSVQPRQIDFDLEKKDLKMNWCFKFQQILCVIFIVLNIYYIDAAAVKNGKKSIAVIGAGVSGLLSARHSLADGHEVTVYEQQDELGGVWVYTDQIGKNEYGVDIHTAMYKGLRCVSWFIKL